MLLTQEKYIRKGSANSDSLFYQLTIQCRNNNKNRIKTTIYNALKVNWIFPNIKKCYQFDSF